MALTHISGTIAELKVFCYSSLPFERTRQLQIMSRETENVLDMNIKDTDTWKALNNAGWTNRRLKEGYKCDNCKRAIAIKKVTVSEFGTYRVDLEFMAKDNIRDMSLFAGRRNMVSRGINLAKGEKYKKSFYIAVTPYIPALSAKRYDDKTIYVSFTHADIVELCDIKVVKEEVPVIWVAGDSTLTDQNAGIPYYPYGSCAGWAQMLLGYTGKGAVCNLAHSGMTTNCFRDDGHFDIAKEMIKKGDFFIIQFGHNDQKRRNLQPFGGYSDNLEKYVEEVRKLGAFPVICSPISRVPAMEDGKYYSLLAPYRDACERVANKLNAPFIDLHDYTFDKWIEFGDSAKDFFIPGDITHTNEYGALLIGDFFVKEITKKFDDSFFDKKIIENSKVPVTDIASEKKTLPKEKPGFDIFGIEPPYVDIKGIPEYEDIKKAFKYCLLDPCVMYAHPYAVMPRAQLLMVMFKAFRMAGKRPYDGEFADISKYDWDAGYIQALVDEDMIDEKTIGHDKESGKKLFRPDDSLTYAEFMSFIVRFLEKDKEKRKKVTLEQSLRKAYELRILGDVSFTKDGKKIFKDTKQNVINEKYEIATETYISRAEIYMGLARFMDIAGGVESDLPSGLDIHPVH